MKKDTHVGVFFHMGQVGLEPAIARLQERCWFQILFFLCLYHIFKKELLCTLTWLVVYFYF